MNDKDEQVPNTDQDEMVARRWPRGLVKLGLSDGYTFVEGFEKRLIRGLGLGEVKLGCKLLLHNISYTSKFLLLTPETVTIKGSQVPELEQFAENRLERTLHLRLGLDVPPEPEFETNAPNALQTLEEEEDARSSTETITIEGDDSLFIDEAAWEEAERKAVEAAQAAAAAAAVARKRASGVGDDAGEVGNGDEEGGDDDDVIIID